jgi:hypothetical protein
MARMGHALRVAAQVRVSVGDDDTAVRVDKRQVALVIRGAPRRRDGRGDGKALPCVILVAMKPSTHLRLSDAALLLLDRCAQARGLTRTAMLEMLLRLFAETAPPKKALYGLHNRGLARAQSVGQSAVLDDAYRSVLPGIRPKDITRDGQQRV